MAGYTSNNLPLLRVLLVDVAATDHRHRGLKKNSGELGTPLTLQFNTTLRLKAG